MLLAQPFDPFKEKRLPFFARCRIISKTRRALFDLKNRMHTHRQYQSVMMPDHHYMLSQQPPPPPPWLCYNCCYDPYLMFPPPPPLPPQVMQPYSICVHISPPHDASSVTESTVYSSSSSLYNMDEKECVEVEESRPKRHPGPVMNRSQSEIISSRPRHRPSVSRWNSDNLYYD
ncbi:hypothetical protein INT47_002409 [Mucor saturninus]|uniref:Uncharacterized protein n=1 Tax=Mucor saturninus TaxID=64648 RepID=A0A8H7RGC0_9FUNG|nr:hypothetical protein INT47_002409 [Mucor saturninus]